MSLITTFSYHNTNDKLIQVSPTTYNPLIPSGNNQTTETWNYYYEKGATVVQISVNNTSTSSQYINFCLIGCGGCAGAQGATYSDGTISNSGGGGGAGGGSNTILSTFEILGGTTLTFTAGLSEYNATGATSSTGEPPTSTLVNNNTGFTLYTYCAPNGTNGYPATSSNGGNGGNGGDGSGEDFSATTTFSSLGYPNPTKISTYGGAGGGQGLLGISNYGGKSGANGANGISYNPSTSGGYNVGGTGNTQGWTEINGNFADGTFGNVAISGSGQGENGTNLPEAGEASQIMLYYQVL